MSDWNGRTPAQESMLVRMRKLNDRHRRVAATEEQLRSERLALYRLGREILLTWDEIGSAFGVSGAAVQQAVIKADNPKPRGKPGRPRGPMKPKATA